MRAFLVISFAVTTAIVSTGALAAGEGQGFRRGEFVKRPAFQEQRGPRVAPRIGVRPPIAATRGQDNPSRFRIRVRPPVQVGERPAIRIKVDNERPPVVNPVENPRLRIKVAPKPQPVRVGEAPTIRIKVDPPRVDAAPQVQPIKVSGPAKVINRDVEVIGAPEPRPAKPVAVAPRPQLDSTEVPEVTGALQAEVTEPKLVAPQVAEIPADADALAAADAAPEPKAAPEAQAEAPVEPKAEPVAPVVKKRKKQVVRYYYDEQDYDSYAGNDDGYSSGGYGYNAGGYNVGYGGGYGGGCD